MQEEQILHSVYFNRLVRLGINKKEANRLLEQHSLERVREIISSKRAETIYLQRNAESIIAEQPHFVAASKSTGRVMTFRPRNKDRKLSCCRPRSKVERALLMSAKVKSETDPLKTLGIVKKNKEAAWLESLYR
ncbi:TPA: hypothetical protein ACNUQQ_003101 [Vibrio cholerae]